MADRGSEAHRGRSAPPPHHLGADVGATKTLLALAVAGRIVQERRYTNRDWPDFPTLLHAFLREAGAPPLAAACFGVAGPVEDGRARLTHLPWSLEAESLSRRFGIGRLVLINDLAAAARGLPALGAEHLVTLQAGRPRPQAPRLLIGAGTGLGVAALLPEGDGWRILDGEGGHVGFSPADEEQLAVWRHLLRPGGRVTAEDVISGPGLAAIHASLGKVSPEGTAMADAAAIVAAATRDARARRALELLVAAWGGFAGDLALLFMARGGVYLGGGIAPRILPWLTAGGFVAAFRRRRVHAGLMADFPLHVVTEERLGLLGALALAAAHTK